MYNLKLEKIIENVILIWIPESGKVTHVNDVLQENWKVLKNFKGWHQVVEKVLFEGVVPGAVDVLPSDPGWVRF